GPVHEPMGVPDGRQHHRGRAQPGRLRSPAAAAHGEHHHDRDQGVKVAPRWREVGAVERMRVMAGVLVFLLAAAAHVGAWQDPVLGISTTKIGPLTGGSSINRTGEVGVIGTDLGIMAEMDGAIYIVFGDTFGHGRGDWRSNVMAYTRDKDPEDGVLLDGWIVDGAGRARELVPGLKEPNDAGGEVTKIPTALTAVGHRLYMAFMS